MEGDQVFAIPFVLRNSWHGAEGHGVDIHALVVRCSLEKQTYHRVGIFWTSLLYLGRQYDYILAGNDFLVKALEQHIAFGESTLDTKLFGVESAAPNISSDNFGTVTASEYKNAADHILLCIYGPKDTPKR